MTPYELNELNASIHKGLWFIQSCLVLVLQQIQQFTYSNSQTPPPQTRTNNPRTFGLMSRTPRHTALYQLAVTQLVQKLPTFYGNKRLFTVFTKAHHWTLIEPLLPAHTSNPILHLHPISVQVPQVVFFNIFSEYLCDALNCFMCSTRPVCIILSNNIRKEKLNFKK